MSINWVNILIVEFVFEAIGIVHLVKTFLLKARMCGWVMTVLNSLIQYNYMCHCFPFHFNLSVWIFHLLHKPSSLFVEKFDFFPEFLEQKKIG